ncbi:glycosyl hydrolase family 61-domain-containing protein [Epithele typhae]|uniref:glycosyl hydrolase family 61-domain-containing protein n=1 Tax=Epithele typhae TaxID=378194 RepID=UPI0020073217|nr:glycosyl hydrolase family 61-domain-containing protein [Epithele typhae]KAH9912921.1 glycosyl hydrolase family 61-domain-containing protein [Epithele typhae]
MSVDPFNVYVARESLVGALRKQPKVSRSDEIRTYSFSLPRSLRNHNSLHLRLLRGLYPRLPVGRSSLSSTTRSLFQNNPVEHSCSTGRNPRDEGPLGQSTTKSLPRAHGKTIVSGKDYAAKEPDASTRVAMLATDNTPSTRRARVISQAASEFQAHSNVSNEYRRSSSVLNKAPPDAMDADPPPPHNGPTTKDSAQLTVPVSVGHCEVDVPVAGFTSKFMDVDARSRRLQSPHATAPVRRGPALRRAAMGRLHVFEWWQQRRLRGSEQWERANLPVLRSSSPAMSALDGTPEFRHRKDEEVVRQRPGIGVDELKSLSLFDAPRANSWRLELPSPNEWHSPSPPAVLTAAAGTSSPAPVLLCQRQDPQMAFQTSDGRPSSDGTMRVAEASPPLRDPHKLHSDPSPPLLLTSGARMPLFTARSPWALRWFKSTKRSGTAGEAPCTRIRVHILGGTVSSSPLDTAAAHRPSPLNANLGTHNPTRSLHLPASPFVPHASGSDHPMSPAPVSTTVIDAPTGALLTAEWYHTLNQATGDPADPIYSSHKGPLISYLAKIPDATQSDATDKMIANAGKVTLTVPECIEDGQYLLRHEIVALHAASSYPGAQLYAQLNIKGESGAKTPSTVSFPGAYAGSDPGIAISIYYPTVKNHTIPAPMPHELRVAANSSGPVKFRERGRKRPLNPDAFRAQDVCEHARRAVWANHPERPPLDPVTTRRRPTRASLYGIAATSTQPDFVARQLQYFLSVTLRLSILHVSILLIPNTREKKFPSTPLPTVHLLAARTVIVMHCL